LVGSALFQFKTGFLEDFIMSMFFSCDWVVTRLKRPDFLSHVYGIGEKYACFPREYNTWKKLANSCHVVPWVLKSPSYEALVSCREELQNYLQFTNCIPVSENIYLETEELHHWGNISRGFRISLEKMGQYNEAIIVGLTQKFPFLAL
jgi:hypothetical protein